MAALGVPRAEWNDNIADLNRLDPRLLAEDEAVRSQVVRFEQRRLVVSAASTDEAALRTNDRAAAVLAQAQKDGLLAGFRSVAPLLPSAQRQREVDEVLRGDATLWPRLRRALAAEGFVADAFEAFPAALAEAPPAPLTWDDFRGTPMQSMVRPFRVSLGDGAAPTESTGPNVAYVSFVHDLRDGDALAERLEAVGARLLDIQGVLTGAYAGYRARMAQLLLVGLVAILLLVALRYSRRRTGAQHQHRWHWWRPTVVACGPALLAAAGTVGALGLCGVPLNILSLVALLMVVSMGVDYGVFLAEESHGAADAERALDATHLAVVVAGVSTAVGFGLLAWSDQPALLSIGLTSGIGVLLCLALAPTMRALTLGSASSRQ